MREKSLFAKIVPMPKPMADWLRAEAFRRRTTKTQLVREALHRYYKSGKVTNYKRNGTMTGHVFIRLDADDADKLIAHCAKADQSANEAVRQAISLMRMKGK